ncbi:MAG TPA: 3-oxoacyl-ACP reductase FabG [Planctomycetota bacterium]|jgi:3-oxoacyl-[acyl-carrier protein] reductase
MANSSTRVALVAGGTGGIGSAVVRKLSQRGLHVVIGWRSNSAEAERVSQGKNASAIRLDLNDPAMIESVCEAVYTRHGRLDVLVNCAAINREAPALGMDDETWQEVLRGNLDGAFRLCRSAAKFMLLGRWGRIVNLSSIVAHRGGRGQINYAAAKAGIEAMTRVLAAEIGRKGVLVNCVAPGVVETEMSKRIRDEHGDRLREEIALRRFATPEEIAEVVAFLVSEECSYITGQTLHADGGFSL